METKALMIDVDQSIKSTGTLNKWDEIGNITEFTNNIKTPKIDDKNRDAVVTGMPSIFARSKMFKLAFESASSAGSQSLKKVYDDLIDEWKGSGHCKEFLNFDKLETYKDFGGIRIEDDVLITSNGCRFLGSKRIPYHPTELEEFMNKNQ